MSFTDPSLGLVPEMSQCMAKGGIHSEPTHVCTGVHTASLIAQFHFLLRSVVFFFIAVHIVVFKCGQYQTSSVNKSWF